MWERPWPRRGQCSPQASIQASVGVRRPLPQNPGPGSGRESGARPCGSGLGRDRADAVRRLRFRLLSGSEDPSHRTPAQAPAASRAPVLVGAALAATGPMQSAGFDSGCCRGQKTPPTEPRPKLRPRVGRRSLWERPWPRQGRCTPQASIPAAVGVRRPLRPQKPSSDAQSFFCGCPAFDGSFRCSAALAIRLADTGAVMNRNSVISSSWMPKRPLAAL